MQCPICRKEQLTLVSWVFGEHLGAISGSARTAESGLAGNSIRRIRHYVVDAGLWGHLVRSYQVGLPRRRDRQHGSSRHRSARSDSPDSSE